MGTDSITIPRWFDRHLHLRDGDMLRTVLPHTLASQATAAVIMGNLPPPNEISTIVKAIAYRDRIISMLPPGSDFTPIMTCYLTDETAPEDVVSGYKEGVWRAVKLYLARKDGSGGTSHSSRAVKDIRGRYPVFAAMEKEGIPLLGHFESVDPEIDEFDREMICLYLNVIPLHEAFPGLKIVFEHITDNRSAEFVVSAGDNVFATVTAHHLMINRNAMFDGGMNPFKYCKPVPKRDDHRRKVRAIVTAGHPRFGAGTDSAPWDEAAKARGFGCSAGIFTAPAAPELYATVFDEDGALDKLGAFMSVNLAEIYGLEPSKETMTLVRGSFTIPERVGTVRVFKGGEILPWKLVGR